MADRFEELRTYVAIVEAGGVNAAAAAIGIARSAVSRRLSELEARLGVTLVERSTRRFELTDAGRALFDDSKRVLGELAALEGRFSGEPVAGQRITVSLDGDLASLLAPAFAEFSASHDGLVIEIIPSTSPAAGDADVRILTAERGAGRRIAELRRVVVCSPGFLAEKGMPGAPADLAQLPGIVIDGGKEQWTFRGGATVRPKIAFVVPNDQTALALAISGAGVAQLPHHLCEDAIERGALTVVLPDYGSKADPVIAEAAAASPLATALVDLLAKAHR